MKLRAVLLLFFASATAFAAPHVRVSATPSPREALRAAAIAVGHRGSGGRRADTACHSPGPLLKPYDKQIPGFGLDAKEAFVLRRLGNTVIVAGFDSSGVLYGALELADRIRAAHAIPATLDIEDHPQIKLRGFALGLQRPEITYEGAEYDYRYTPEEFPGSTTRLRGRSISTRWSTSVSTRSTSGMAILLRRC